MAVDEEGAHAHGVGFEDVGLQILLHHDVVADHAATFAHIECVGPVGVVGEFVFAQAPGAGLSAQALGYTLIVTEKPQHALDEVGVVLPDAGACGGIAIRIVEIGTGVVGGEEALRIEVVFAVGGFAKVEEAAKADAWESFDQAQQQFVVSGIVAGGFGEGVLDVLTLGDADAEVVALGAIVGAAGCELGVWEDAVDGLSICIQAGDAHGGAVDVARAFAADAGAIALHHFHGAWADGHGVVASERLAILRGALAADDVADLGRCHEVAFIAGVNELLAVVGGAVARGQAGDACAVFGDRFERLVCDDFDACLFEHGLEGGHVGPGLGIPHGRVGFDGCSPCEVLSRKAADGFLLAHVRAGQASCDHAADPFGGLDHHHGCAFSCGGDSCAQS